MIANDEVKKCRGVDCSHKSKCGRYAMPSTPGVSFGDFDDKPTDDCGHFVPMRSAEIKGGLKND